MSISHLIRELSKIKDKHGDLDVYYYNDSRGIDVPVLKVREEELCIYFKGLIPVGNMLLIDKDRK